MVDTRGKLTQKPIMPFVMDRNLRSNFKLGVIAP